MVSIKLSKDKSSGSSYYNVNLYDSQSSNASKMNSVNRINNDLDLSSQSEQLIDDEHK